MIIKRRKQGEYHNTHLIMWQFDDDSVRFFFNVFHHQIVFDFFRPHFSLRIRKSVDNNDPYRSNRYI